MNQQQGVHDREAVQKLQIATKFLSLYLCLNLLNQVIETVTKLMAMSIIHLAHQTNYSERKKPPYNVNVNGPLFPNSNSTEL